MARMFYSWVQVRNIGAVETYNMEKAKLHYNCVQMRKAFYAWWNVMVGNRNRIKHKFKINIYTLHMS